MKKCLFFLFVLPKLAFGDGGVKPPPPVAPNFSVTDLSAGMVSFPSENRIPDNAASYIQNFYTDIQPLAVERNGSVRRDSTVLGGGSGTSVSQLARFVDSSGTEWIISFASQTFYKNTIGGTPTAFGLNASVTTKPRYAINLGKIWFVNGSDSLWWFDGTSTGSVASAPIGTLIVPWRQRLVIGNVTNNQSTLYVSGDGAGTDWTINVFSTSPFTTPIGGANDGENIRCLWGAYQDTLIIGKKFNLWALNGFSQADFTVRNISYEVGCIEPDTMREKDGTLIWLSARGLEQMSSTSIQTISEPIRDLTDVLVKNTTNQRSNIQTSQADWGAGTVSGGTSFYVDTITVPGNLQTTFPDNFATYRNGTNGTKLVWADSCYQGCNSTSVVQTNGNLTINVGNSDETLLTRGQGAAYAAGTTYYFTVTNISTGVTNTSDLTLYLSSISALQTNPNTLNNYFAFRWFSTAPATMSLSTIFNFDGANTTLCAAPCQTTTSAVPAQISVWLSTVNYSVTVNGTQVTAGTHTFSNYPLGAYLEYFWGRVTPLGSITFSNFSIVPQTFTFTSQQLAIGNSISAWGPVTISDVKSGGALTYQFGSTSSAVLSNISNYTTILNGQIPSVSTNAFAAFKATFNDTTATNTIALNEFDTSWTEGSANPSPISWVYDRRYWLSFTTATTSNPLYDTVLLYQRNNTWTLFKGINAASFTTWRYHLFYGNSNATGLVYQFDIGNNDDGNAITSQLNTKAYDLGYSYRNKDLRHAYINYLANNSFSGSFSASYDVDSQGTPFSLGSANMNEAPGLNPAKFQFPLTNPTQGYAVKFLISKSGTGDRLKLYDIVVKYDLKEGK